MRRICETGCNSTEDSREFSDFMTYQYYVCAGIIEIIKKYMIEYVKGCELMSYDISAELRTFLERENGRKGFFHYLRDIVETYDKNRLREARINFEDLGEFFYNGIAYGIEIKKEHICEDMNWSDKTLTTIVDDFVNWEYGPIIKLFRNNIEVINDTTKYFLLPGCVPSEKRYHINTFRR